MTTRKSLDVICSVCGRQWQRLLEIQQIQTELMEEIASHRRLVE